MNWRLFQLFYSYIYHLENGLKLYGENCTIFDTLRKEKHQAIFQYFGGDRIKNRDGLYLPDSLGEFIEDVLCDVLSDSKGILYVKLLHSLQKPKHKKWLKFKESKKGK